MLEVTGDLPGWQTAEMTYFMTPTLDFSPSLSLGLSPTLILAGFLISYVFFPTSMPHYILKVNPINTEITLEDKLLRKAFFFRPDYHCMESLPSFYIDKIYQWEFLIVNLYILTRLFSLRKTLT